MFLLHRSAPCPIQLKRRWSHSILKPELGNLWIWITVLWKYIYIWFIKWNIFWISIKWLDLQMYEILAFKYSFVFFFPRVVSLCMCVHSFWVIPHDPNSLLQGWQKYVHKIDHFMYLRASDCSTRYFCLFPISFLKDILQYPKVMMQFGCLCKCLQGVLQKNYFSVCYIV